MTMAIIEQCVCWLFAAVLVVVALRLMHKERLSYAFVLVLCSIAFFFCGLSGMQSLLKTGLLWKVTHTLVDYGDKINRFQLTVADMKSDLDSQQATNIQQRVELAKVQELIRAMLLSVDSQQTDITNQYHDLFVLGTRLATTQTNIDAQEKQLADVTRLVETLYKNTFDEVFTGSDTNHVAVQNLGNAKRVFFRLTYSPVPYTINAMASKGGLFGQMSLFPQMAQAQNVLVTYFEGSLDVKGMEFHIRYIRNSGETNLVHSIELQSTNILCIDGLNVTLP